MKVSYIARIVVHLIKLNPGETREQVNLHLSKAKLNPSKYPDAWVQFSNKLIV